MQGKIPLIKGFDSKSFYNPYLIGPNSTGTHFLFVREFELFVLKVFVTYCQVSIVIKNNSLLYSIVINEKIV